MTDTGVQVQLLAVLGCMSLPGEAAFACLRAEMHLAEAKISSQSHEDWLGRAVHDGLSDEAGHLWIAVV